jgi:hypothetical protein
MPEFLCQRAYFASPAGKRAFPCSLPPCGGGLGRGVSRKHWTRGTPHPSPLPQGERERTSVGAAVPIASRSLLQSQSLKFVMPGHSRPKDGVASARLCPGHPRLLALAARKTWIAGTSPAMTKVDRKSLRMKPLNWKTLQRFRRSTHHKNQLAAKVAGLADPVRGGEGLAGGRARKENSPVRSS